MTVLSQQTALIVGVGGLGCPVALALCRAGLGRVLLLDEDDVEETNLHRQILFRSQDVGTSKPEAARRSLLADGASPQQVECISGRLLPDTARDLVKQADIVLEGADNFATKFLAADACALESRAVVHGAAVAWRATVLTSDASGRPCYRCVFEDVPRGAQANCSTAGVMGPVVGIAGALMADRALRLLSGETVGGTVTSFDGLTDVMRTVRVVARPDCALCGSAPRIESILESRYLSDDTCAA